MIIDFIKSPMNFTGGKYKLLPELMNLFPRKIDTFVDLFTGGANVAVNLNALSIYANDVNEGIISLFTFLKAHSFEEVIEKLDYLIGYYHLSNSSIAGYDFYQIKSADGLGNFNREKYLQLRTDFNEKKFIIDKNLVFFALIIFGFNNQIRFNRKGEFNIPVGKRDFNKNVRENLKEFMDKIKEKNISFSHIDFRSFPFHSLLKEADFVYCDPPYLIANASYNEQGGWTRTDEEDLLLMLDELHLLGVKFALSNVLEKEGVMNDLLIEWSQRYYIHDIKVANYTNSNYQKKKSTFKEREVLITNYKNDESY